MNLSRFSAVIVIFLLSACFPALGPDQARVTRVIDGDTIEVEFQGQTYTVRYIGIDTPETYGGVEPFGQEAKEANRRFVEGKIVRLEKDVSETDRFGRLLRYVYVDDLMVNAELVRLGYAVVSTFPPDVKYVDLFLQLEREAREAGRGLWGQESASEIASTVLPTSTATATRSPTSTATSTSTATPTATATFTPVPFGSVSIGAGCSQFDAPGNDNENKVEEYVCLRNVTGQPLDLEGWRLMDQKGYEGREATRYLFPEFTLASQYQVRVHTGCGETSATDLYWCKEGLAVWTNDGDTAYLYDATGSLVAQYSY